MSVTASSKVEYATHYLIDPLYQNRIDGSVWWIGTSGTVIVPSVRNYKGPAPAPEYTLYEVDEDGEVTFRIVDGVWDEFPIGTSIVVSAEQLNRDFGVLDGMDYDFWLELR